MYLKLLKNTPAQTESQLHSVEQAAENIALCVNSVLNKIVLSSL